MRCGSTWLYEALKCHPGVQLSEAKELDFFFMHQMLRHDLEWYKSNFAPAEGLAAKPVRGEISPSYVRLKAWQVRRIADLLPDLRIILTLRHPIDRIWSQALYQFGYWEHRDIRSIRPIDFLREVEKTRYKLSSDYPRSIKIWSDAFSRTALHIDFFDRLKNDPQTYIDGVLKHIGGAAPWSLPPALINNKVFGTTSLVKQRRAMPEVVRWYIADRVTEPTERLNELLDGQVSSWVDELRDIRGKTRLSWRLLKELNRTVLSIPHKIGYYGYHALLDLRLWLRWRELRKSHDHKAATI
jgi:hypothetical protein